VREESHLDDMRSAIRGDFERLAERRGDQELMKVTDVDAPLDEDGTRAVAREPEVPSERAPDPERRSWLARLVSP
jgi:hypothetical protein